MPTASASPHACYEMMSFCLPAANITNKIVNLCRPLCTDYMQTCSLHQMKQTFAVFVVCQEKTYQNHTDTAQRPDVTVCVGMWN